MFAIIGIIIKLTSTGPILYKQESVGGKGRPVMLYKFRTLTTDADFKLTNSEFKEGIDIQKPKTKENQKVTKIGNFLVKSGLDQLPQLFNVLKGEMAVLGPNSTLYSEKLQQLDN